jgi:nicotinate phosphoribosyltransferase
MDGTGNPEASPRTPPTPRGAPAPAPERSAEPTPPRPAEAWPAEERAPARVGEQPVSGSTELARPPAADWAGSAPPLPVLGPGSRTSEGRLASWVFDLPVAELRAGYRSAVYFDRSRRILAAEGLDTEVTMQVFQRTKDVVACGVDEALAVLAQGAGAFTDQGAADEVFAAYLVARNAARQARVRSGASYLEAVRAQVEAEVRLDTLWRPGGEALRVRALRDGDRVDAWEPVIEITGPYRFVSHLESVYLGVLARRTLVATNVRRVVDAAKGKPVLFFADRFDHWATQGGDGYAAFIGGAQGVATDAQAAWWGERGLGTVPHALIATFGGDTVEAMQAFARHVPHVPLIALVDFHNDSVRDSLACARAFGDRLWGVRLDTASTMVDRSLWDEMGDFNPTGVNARLVEKVRTALDAEGFQHVRVICSGGFNAERISAFEAAGVPVDSYAVGSALLKGSADYTADVVLREGQPCAKVGRRHRPSERLEPVDLTAHNGWHGG